MKSFFAASVSLAVLAAVSSTGAMAQDTTTEAQNDQGLGTIVVTAQRRSEDIQSAALTITAVDGDTLREQNITQVENLAQLSPGLQVNTSAGPYASFSVRSVSSLSGNAFADPAVAVNLDGVYLATPTVLHGLYFDLARVEILKGPQGTLYGRNATAGAINIIPNRPEFRTGGNIYTDIGNFNRTNVGGALNVALSDTVAVRLAGQLVRRDGYMSDGSNDDRGSAIRGSILFEPTTDLSILISGDYSHVGGIGTGATIRKECGRVGISGGGACFVAADPYTGIADLASQYTSVGEAPPTRNQFIDGDYYGGLVNIDYDTSIGTFTLLAAHRESDNAYKGTGTSWQLDEEQHPKQTSAELRLASSGSSPLNYVFGLYWLDTTMDSRSQSESLNRKRFSDSFTHNEGWTWAAFTQLTYSLTDALRVTGGLRYTYEHKMTDSSRYNLNLVGPDPVFPATPTGTPALVLQEEESWDAINWKAGLEFDAAEDSMLYATVSTGFKAGGFYYGPPGFNTYQPEHVTSYEIGSKNRFAGNTIRLNLSAFYLDYTDQQVSFVKLIPAGGTALVTENAGSSTAWGLEWETEFLPAPDTRIGFSGAWIHARYDQFQYNTIAPPSSSTLCNVTPGFVVDCSGLPPYRTPEWTLSASFEQGFELGDGSRVAFDARGTYKSTFYADTSYQIESRTNHYKRVNIGLSWEDPTDSYTVRAYVDNLFDQVTISNATVNTAYTENYIVGVNLLAPRTYGLQATARF